MNNNQNTKDNEKPSRFKQYFARKLLYNSPMIVDLCSQPRRFLILYYMTYYTISPVIKWLKSNQRNDDVMKYSFAKLITYSCSTIYKYLFPSAIKTFEWTSYNYQISYLFIASMGCFTSFIYSYLYFNNALNDRLEWPYVYNYLMNKNFTNSIRNLLNNYPLNDTFHIDVTLKLYPIIYTQQQQYLDNNNNENVYELKIVQFTAANVAWYSSKWSKVSIQSKQHRIVGVFLCDYDLSESEEQRKANKKEIRESIMKIKKTRLNDLNVYNKLDWCKNMCLTLQTHFDGHWVVIIGHRAQYRSFHSVILKNKNINQQQQQIENTQLQTVQFTVNNKTDAEFFHFGFGPKWFNWSVVIAKIS